MTPYRRAAEREEEQDMDDSKIVKWAALTVMVVTLSGFGTCAFVNRNPSPPSAFPDSFVGRCAASCAATGLQMRRADEGDGCAQTPKCECTAIADGGAP